MKNSIAFDTYHIMFSEMSVSHSIHREGLPAKGLFASAGCLPMKGVYHQGSASRGCLPPGKVCLYGVCPTTPWYWHLLVVTAAVSTHTCYWCVLGWRINRTLLRFQCITLCACWSFLIPHCWLLTSSRAGASQHVSIITCKRCNRIQRTY